MAFPALQYLRRSHQCASILLALTTLHSIQVFRYAPELSEIMCIPASPAMERMLVVVFYVQENSLQKRREYDLFPWALMLVSYERLCSTEYTLSNPKTRLLDFYETQRRNVKVQVFRQDGYERRWEFPGSQWTFLHHRVPYRSPERLTSDGNQKGCSSTSLAKVYNWSRRNDWTRPSQQITFFKGLRSSVIHAMCITKRRNEKKMKSGSENWINVNCSRSLRRGCFFMATLSKPDRQV